LKPSIGIIAPNYKRPKVLHLFCESIKRIRQELKVFIPVVIISEEEDKDLCGQYYINHITQKNVYLSEKFNRGITHMRDMGADYVCILGSDDIVSTNTIERIITETEKGYDLIGVNSIYFYAGDGIHRGKMVKLEQPRRMMGVGKTIKMDILAQINYRPWDKEKNWGLDAMAQQSILPYIRTQTLLNDTVIVDVKTKDNLNKSSMWMNKIKQLTDPQIFYNVISEEEKQILWTL